MSGIIGGITHAAGMAGGGLARQLDDLAAAAGRAARFAEGEYIPQLSRANELQVAFKNAGRAAQGLEDLAPRIAVLDAGNDGLRLAKAALNDLDAGRQILKAGVAIEDDVLRSGGVVTSPTTISDATARFNSARSTISDIAAIARAEETSVDDLFRAITGRG